MPPTLATLIFCRRGAEILLMKRRKPPFVDHWVAPGGKLEPGEAPYDCARRELREETCLHAPHLELAGIITETSPRADFQWLLFVYRADDPDGKLQGDAREGEFAWWHRDRLTELRLPAADRVFVPRLLDDSGEVYQATFRYDTELTLIQVEEHGSQRGL